jgi:flagellar hook-associated protein 3 FlgL
MRVNPDITSDVLAALARTRGEEERALTQMSSGRRVNVPSDDPAAAAMLVVNHAQAASTDQFLRSVDGVRVQLQTADSALNSVVLALQRAISLGTEGANGTLSDANRASITQELEGVQDQILNLANLSFQGEYVFAGTNNRTQPFVLDNSDPSGVSYAGNAGVNSVRIGEGLNLQVNLPGTTLFLAPAGNTFQAVQNLIQAMTTGSGIGEAVGQVRTAFDNVTAQRVFYGNALNQLDSQDTNLNNVKLQVASAENQIGGADLADTTSQLVNAQSSRDATLAAAARIGQDSLFDYLK